MVLRTVRWEAGPRERCPKALKTKLAQGEPSSLSSLRSDSSLSRLSENLGTRMVAETAPEPNTVFHMITNLSWMI
jgi:hypothetical protein